MASGRFSEDARIIRYTRAKQMLDVGTTKLFELIKDGYLDTVTMGKRGKRITVESIERFIEQNKQRSRPPSSTGKVSPANDAAAPPKPKPPREPP